MIDGELRGVPVEVWNRELTPRGVAGFIREVCGVREGERHAKHKELTPAAERLVRLIRESAARR